MIWASFFNTINFLIVSLSGCLFVRVFETKSKFHVLDLIDH